MVRLSDSEWNIMELLWDSAPRTMTEITKELAGVTGWTKHTVITYLKRMEEKGVLHYEEGEKAKLYYPDITRQEASLQETEQFLGKVFQGKMGLMLNAMVQQNALTEDDIEELYDILKKAGK